ncbi:cytochrome D1 domain-containing protein [Natrinema longum]|uniref:Twin-arginine translocation signal domain-containing protein n=1 Tax=Natrinema longum TaxID=370324 RepID=A0A8A2U884_9EURY|nr:cytochrome D1 domain-containing protein [Natrinema longum]MBZ6493806.1 twin-arginine translocation signal domain-containing protein [Natrinema longum]QSW84857.1 twin-arginine translocation signal domain-containing protein [Natrinema longum]
MSQSESAAQSMADHEERIKRHLSASREIAKNLEFDDELHFEMGLPSPGRRTFLKTSGIVAASAALAGCASNEDDDSPGPTDDDEDGDSSNEGTSDAQQSETVQLSAHQYEFQPQEIRVAPNTELTIEFTESTFEQNSDFKFHTFYLEEPYDVGPVNLPENTDDEVIDSVTFVTDEEGTFDFECNIYCGDGHAQMNGQLYVVPEGESVDKVDFTDMETLKERHEVLKEESELAQEPQHDLDLRDIMVVTERNNASVAMIDTVNDELMERVENVGKAIHVHDFHPELPEQTREGAYVYTQSRQGEMYKIDLFDFERVAVADAGTDARDIAVSRDGNYVIGGFYNPNHLVICDADTMEPIKRIPTHTVNPDGESLGSRVCSLYDVPHEGLFLAGLKEGGEVWLIDYTQEEFPVVATIECGRTLHDGFFTDDGRYFMIASQTDNQMDIIDTQERSHVAAIPMDGVPHPGPGALYPDEDLAFTTHAGAPSVGVWNTETWEAEQMIDVRGSGLFIRKHENSDYVWADVILTDSEDDAYVYTIDPETLEVDQEIDCSQWGAAAAIHPEFSRDGEKVYISVWMGENESILVFDPNTGELLTQIEDLLAPTGKFLGVRAEGH